MNNIFISSKSADWTTPNWLYKQLDDEFHFELDAACTNENCKCPDGLIYYSEEDNALTINWWNVKAKGNGTCKSIFCNPPYNNLEKWIIKGFEAYIQGCTVVFLLPCTKSDQEWWHTYVVSHAEIRYIKGRLKFGGCKNAAPFPSVVVIFGNKTVPRRGIGASYDNK